MPFWRAFQVLSRCRSSGFGVGYIPLSEIVHYLDEFGIDGTEDRQEHIHWIMVIDAAYVKHMNDEHKQKSASKKPAGRKSIAVPAKQIPERTRKR